MKEALKKLLFGRGRSSLNLFMAMPVLILTSICCLCPDSKNVPQNCLTSNGENLVWAGFDLLNISLADGSITTLERATYTDVMCSENNEIISFKEESVQRNGQRRSSRTAFWPIASKSYRLVDIESFQKYLGFIQKRYFVSSSRSYIVRERSSGKSKVRYNVYDQPQVFTLEDSINGQIKSHYLYREKLGLPENVNYHNLWFYPLKLDESGTLAFAMKQDGDQSVNFYKIDMFEGSISRTGAPVALPAEMRELEAVTTDKSGKFIGLVYKGAGKDSYSEQKQINIINAETAQLVVSKNLSGVAFNAGTPLLIFNENSAKLAIDLDGFYVDPVRNVNRVMVFDLETGSELANIDADDFFKKPDSVGLIKFIGDDLLFIYSARKKDWRRELEKRLCKVSLTTKQIVWDIKLPDK